MLLDSYYTSPRRPQTPGAGTSPQPLRRCEFDDPLLVGEHEAIGKHRERMGASTGELAEPDTTGAIGRRHLCPTWLEKVIGAPHRRQIPTFASSREMRYLARSAAGTES